MLPPTSTATLAGKDGGEGGSDQEQRDLLQMRQANIRLQQKVEQLQRREMALLRALDGKQRGGKPRASSASRRVAGPSKVKK